MKKKTKKRLYIAISAVTGILLITASVYLYLLYVKITDVFISRGFPSPSIVYSAPTYFKQGMGIGKQALIDKLNRLGYNKVTGIPEAQASYSVSGNTVYVYTKSFLMPSYKIPGIRAIISLSSDRISSITTFEGNTIDSIELEPEQLAVFFGDDFKMRIPVNLPDMPDNLINAVIVTEDVRFFEHGALDIDGILRAMFEDIFSMRIKQGGSTITQQLVKVLFLSNKRSFKRKVAEAIMAIMLAHRFTKAQILNAYLNNVYLGQDGHVSIIGMGAAAKYYFSRSVNELSTAQCAMLAGLIASPYKYSPIFNKQEALNRRNYVLSRMKKYNVITEAEYLSALHEPLSVTISHINVKLAPYFVDYIADQLSSSFSKELLTTDGLRIFTTLNPDIQLMAEKAMADAPPYLQGAMVVMQPQTGYVLAMIGGRDYNRSQFNRAVMSRRQIGSCVKPFIYMLAFEDKAKDGFSQITKIDDAPFVLKTRAGIWKPENYNKRFLGPITVRYALQHSINIPAVKISMDIGLDKISNLLEQLGLGTDIPSFPSIALGSLSTSPLELCLAYSIFSNRGYEPVSPVSIKAVTDMHNNIVFESSLQFKPIGSEQACYVVNNILLGSETEGTGRGLRRFDISGDYAGKTGTTNDFRDTWFAGYTPDVVAVAWLGYDNETRVGLPAADVALPVVGRFLSMYTHLYGGKQFSVPGNIRFACVDRYTGLSGSNVTDCVKGAFIAGTEPHGNAINSIIDWFKHLFTR
ncbi:MAG: PBP1A family penicillin-binding protein [bacterium]